MEEDLAYELRIYNDSGHVASADFALPCGLSLHFNRLANFSPLKNNIAHSNLYALKKELRQILVPQGPGRFKRVRPLLSPFVVKFLSILLFAFRS